MDLNGKPLTGPRALLWPLAAAQTAMRALLPAGRPLPALPPRRPAVRSSALERAWERQFRGAGINADPTLLAESFAASVTAYACTVYDAEATSNVALKVTAKDGTPLADHNYHGDNWHPLTSVTENSADLLWLIQASRKIWGVAYLRKVYNEHVSQEHPKGYPVCLEWVNNTDVQPERDYATDTIRAYYISSGGRQERLAPADMVVVPGFDPRDRHGAISDYEVALRNIALERNIVSYGGSFFFNGGLPAGILSNPHAGEEETRAVAQEWKALLGGATNAHRLLVLGGMDAEWELNQLDANLRDMAMVELDDQQVKKICAAMRVDPALVGLAYVSDALSAGATRDSIERDHYRVVTLGSLSKICRALNQQWAWVDFEPEDHFTLAPDLSSIEALSRLTGDQVDYAVRMKDADIWTRNEARLFTGADVDDEEDALGHIDFERNPAAALSVLTVGGMSVNEFRAFMEWPSWGDNGNVVLVNGAPVPVARLLEFANANAEALPGGGMASPFGLLPFGPAPTPPAPPAPSTPAPPSQPEPPAPTPTGQEQAPENIDSTEGLNGAQITAALDIISTVASGTNAPSVGIELLLALGLSRDRAQRMIDDTVANVSPPALPEPRSETVSDLRQEALDFGFDVPLPDNQVLNEYRLLAEEGAGPGVEWVPPTDWHLSLIYADEPQPAALVREFLKTNPLSVETVFDIYVDRLEAWDTEEDGRVLVAMFDEEALSTLRRTQADLYLLFAEAGIAPNTYTYPDQWKPHVALAYNWPGDAPTVERSEEPVWVQSIRLLTPERTLYEWHLAEMEPQEPSFDARKELTNWQHKVNRRGPDAPFEPEHIPARVFTFVRTALDDGDAPDDVFTRARDLLTHDAACGCAACTTATRAEPETDDPALLEEFRSYWQRFDELQTDIGVDWAAWMGRVGDRIVKRVVDDPDGTVDLAWLEPDDAFVEAWVGTADEPGPLLALLLAGMAAGNDALDRAITANPHAASKRAAMVVSWDVLLREAVDFARGYAFDLIRDLNDTTVTQLREIVSTWAESGEGVSALEQALLPVFYDLPPVQGLGLQTRVASIAQTEATRTFSEGAFRRMENAGVHEATWQNVNDRDVCPICRALPRTGAVRFRDGWVHPGGAGDAAKYAGQVFRMPAHPGCRCFPRPKVV